MLTPIVVGNVEVVTLDMVKVMHGEANTQNFLDWLKGQTTPVIRGIECFYYDDYVRWYHR